jgi:hypothetical protein
MGALLFALSVTGAIGRGARFIPQSVSAGLQLGLGILMGVLGIGLVLKTPWLGFGALALLLVLMHVPRCSAAPLMLVITTLAGSSAAEVTLPDGVAVCMGPAEARASELGGCVAQRRACRYPATSARAHQCRDCNGKSLSRHVPGRYGPCKRAAPGASPAE